MTRAEVRAGDCLTPETAAAARERVERYALDPLAGDKVPVDQLGLFAQPG